MRTSAYTCSNGHKWDPFGDSLNGSSDGFTCPVCGSKPIPQLERRFSRTLVYLLTAPVGLGLILAVYSLWYVPLTCQPVCEFKPSILAVSVMCFSPDDATLAAGFESGVGTIWLVSQRYRQLTFPAHRGKVTFLKFLDAQTFVTSGLDNKICVWDRDKAERITVLPGQGPTRPLRLVPNTRTLISAGANGEVFSLNLDQPPKWSFLLKEPGVVDSLALSDDGKWLLTLYQSGSERFAGIWDLKAKTKQRSLPISEPGNGIAVSAANELLFAQEEGRLKGWDFAGVERLLAPEKLEFVPQLQLLPDESLIGALENEPSPLGKDRIRLFDTASGRPVRTLPNSGTSYTAFAFSSDGTLLASGSSDGPVRIWRIKDLLSK